MCSLLGGLLAGPLVLPGAHLVLMLLLEVVTHHLRTGADEAILGAAQPQVVVLPHVVVEGDIIGVPELANWADIHPGYLRVPVGEEVGTPH